MYLICLIELFPYLLAHAARKFFCVLKFKSSNILVNLNIHNHRHTYVPTTVNAHFVNTLHWATSMMLKVDANYCGELFH